MDYALLAYFTLAFAVIMYVVLDGFDLGLGILLPFAADEGERERMIASVAPVWDGNETWLVLGGAVLFAAFPVAYAILLAAWYLPLTLMLCALVLRGAAFAFRPEARRKWPWNTAFSAGSLLAALCQGSMLGSFIQGLPVRGHAHAGSTWDWLTPFSLMTAVAVATGYALLGATWLILKSDGGLQARCYRIARPLLLALAGFLVLVSLWTPLTEPVIAARWFHLPTLFQLAPVPVLTAAVGILLWHGLARRWELALFLLTLALFLLALLGLVFSVWPYIVPWSHDLHTAAASPATLRFILLGVALLLPLVLAYTAHTYRLFRGKAAPGGYG